MSKHTPGPWEVGSYREPHYDHELTYNVLSDGFIVARCGKGFETKENAHLIAAAPELLEALTEARKYIAGEPFGLGWSVKRIDDLIFATGGGNDAD